MYKRRGRIRIGGRWVTLRPRRSIPGSSIPQGEPWPKNISTQAGYVLSRAILNVPTNIASFAEKLEAAAIASRDMALQMTVMNKMMSNAIKAIAEEEDRAAMAMLKEGKILSDEQLKKVREDLDRIKANRQPGIERWKKAAQQVTRSEPYTVSSATFERILQGSAGLVIEEMPARIRYMIMVIDSIAYCSCSLDALDPDNQIYDICEHISLAIRYQWLRPVDQYSVAPRIEKTGQLTQIASERQITLATHRTKKI